MPPISAFLDIVLHIDEYLGAIIQSYSAWTYALLFLVVFLETGFVVTPFLPGDSLLFAVGSFAALGSLDITMSIIILLLAAVLGDTVNYFVGYAVGPKVFKEESRFFKKEYLDRTREFYQKHGKKSIVLARFIPIIRTFAPFVAGIGKMDYAEFLKYNVLGGILWVLLFTLGGYVFGNIPFVKENFSVVVIVIIISSFMPLVWEIFKSRRNL